MDHLHDDCITIIHSDMLIDTLHGCGRLPIWEPIGVWVTQSLGQPG